MRAIRGLDAARCHPWWRSKKSFPKLQKTNEHFEVKAVPRFETSAHSAASYSEDGEQDEIFEVTRRRE